MSYPEGRAGIPQEGKAAGAAFYILCSLHVPGYVGLCTWKKLFNTLTRAVE